jgi:hypothetical protein
MYAAVAGLSYHLPKACLTAAQTDERATAENIDEKTGIGCGTLPTPKTTSDLAVMANRGLFGSGVSNPSIFGFCAPKA